MLAISDSLTISQEDVATLQKIISKYGFSNFNIIMFQERNAQVKYEIYTELTQEYAMEDLREVLTAMLSELTPLQDSIRKDC